MHLLRKTFEKPSQYFRKMMQWKTSLEIPFLPGDSPAYSSHAARKHCENFSGKSLETTVLINHFQRFRNA